MLIVNIFILADTLNTEVCQETAREIRVTVPLQLYNDTVIGDKMYYLNILPPIFFCRTMVATFCITGRTVHNQTEELFAKTMMLVLKTKQMNLFAISAFVINDS